MKKEHEPQDWKEDRLLRPWELSQQGWMQKDIAAVLGDEGGFPLPYSRRKDIIDSQVDVYLPCSLITGRVSDGNQNKRSANGY